jgi:hypothetical protein
MLPMAQRKPCFKWTAAGTCSFGTNCKYFHDPETPARVKYFEKIAHEQLEQRRKEQQRRLQEAEEQARRDAARASYEAELAAKRQELAAVDAARTLTREVDGCLVTFAAGLSVDTIIASFNVVRGRITDLPQKIRAMDLIDHFQANGISGSMFSVSKGYRSDAAFVTIASQQVIRIKDLSRLHGVQLKFTPFRSHLADDTASAGNAFSRTLVLTISRRAVHEANFLDDFQRQLETQARGHGFRSIRKEVQWEGGSNVKVRFLLEFDTWENARHMQDTLRRLGVLRYGGIIVPLKNFFLPSKYSHPIFVSASQHEVQKTQWNELAQRCREDNCDLKSRELPGDKIRINIHGDNLDVVGPMKVRAEQLARGTTISLWNRRLFDASVAQRLTDDIQETTGALVQVDKRLRCLKAYGPSMAVERAREQLELYADELAKKEYTRELTSQRMVRFFVEVGYPQLKETYGEDAVVLDLTSVPKKITVTGDEEIRHRLDNLTNESTRDWMSMRNTQGEGQDCPICMMSATAPTVLGCGHVYCTECLTHFFKSALESSTFPLRCSGDENRCGVPIPISQLEKFLHAPKFQELLEAAFHAYIEQNPNVLSPCKTPGCSQLYTRATVGRGDGSSVVTCPSCFVAACAACGKNAHQGVSCEMAGRDLSEEYINTSSDIKRCPRCAAPIFKDGGCNHVSCRCGAHMCWRCNRVFNDSQACYGHMRADHGGYFDHEMDAAPRAHRDERAEAQAAVAAAAAAAVPREFIEEDAWARALAAGIGMRDAVRADQRRQEEAERRRGELLRQIAERNALQEMERRRREVLAEEALRWQRAREQAQQTERRGGWGCVVM